MPAHPIADKEWFYCLTLDNGEARHTQWGTLTPVPNATRQDLFKEIHDNIVKLHPSFSNAPVIFFELQPNKMT